MSAFVHEVQQEKSYRRAIFLFVSLAVAGICSIYPVMCFKNHSTKEKYKENRGVAELERRQMEREDEDYHHRPRSSTPLFSETVAAPESSPLAAGRGSGVSFDTPERPLPQGPRLRSVSGQGEEPSPPRPCATEAVPSQLVGGRARSDAYFLRTPQSASSLPSDSPKCSPVSSSEYAKARKDSAAGKLKALLSPHLHPREDGEQPPSQSNGGQDSPPKTPSTGSSANTQVSLKSGASDASSFAYLLRDNRADRRLLHQKSQPLEHQKKHALGARKSMPVQRSPSYYKPRVVEDSAAPVAAAKPQTSTKPVASVTIAEFIKAAQPAPPSKLKTPPLRKPSPARPRKKTISSTQRPNFASTSNAPAQLSTPPESPLSRPGLKKSSTLQDISRYQSVAKPLRLETPPARPALSDKHSGSKGSRDRSRDRPKHLTLPPPSKADAFINDEHYHNVTPPEAEPGSPGHSRFRHGDHYFRTFGGETMYVKEFTPTMMPTTPAAPSPISISPLPDAGSTREPGVRRPSDAGLVKQKKRKRSSIFKLFRKSALTDSTYETPNSPIIGTRPPKVKKLPTPDISVNPPREPPVRPPVDDRTSSEMSLPPYFAQPRKHTSSDDGASSSMISPLTKAEAAARPSMHGRLPSSRSSDELTVSPLSRPRSRPRLRHRITLADMDEGEEVPGSMASKRLGLPTPNAPAPAPSGPKPLLDDSKQYSETKLTKNDVKKSGALRWEPTEGHRISTPLEEPVGPPGDKKRSIFKHFFSMSELRHQPPTPPASTPNTEPVTPKPQITKRRSSITHNASFATLIRVASKPSINKLRKTMSQPIAQPETPDPPKSLIKPLSKHSLEVRDFQQTPYAQRVTNTRRAETVQVRAFVEEALEADDADEVQLGFELGVPDHLPGSPLCPLSPKHKSGGKAICPLHGRRAPPPPKMMAKGTIGKAAKAEAKIVYEGTLEGARKMSGKSVDWADVKERRLSGELTGDAWYEEDSE